MPSRKYAVGRKAWFICGRCGQRGLYIESTFDGHIANLRVHKECYEPKHPQENLPRVTDPIALYRPSPEWGGVAPVAQAVINDDSSVTVTWTEAEVFNARFESYDVYRAVVDPVTGEPGDYTLIESFPITYDEFMAITSQTLTLTDLTAEYGVTYDYKVIANAAN